MTDTARPPVALAGRRPARVLLWRLRAGRALHVPIALFGAGVVTFLATGLAGLSVLPRYLTIPVVAVCLVAGYGVLGFTTLPAGRVRRAVVARGDRARPRSALVFVAIKAPVVGTLRGELRFIRGSHDDLVAILHAPAVQRDLRCGPLTFPNYRLVPDSRWLLDLPARRVGARSARRRTRGVAMFVLGAKELKRYGFAAGASPSTNVPDPGFVPDRAQRGASAPTRPAAERASPAPRRTATMHRSSAGRPSAWRTAAARRPGDDVGRRRALQRDQRLARGLLAEEVVAVDLARGARLGQAVGVEQDAAAGRQLGRDRGALERRLDPQRRAVAHAGQRHAAVEVPRRRVAGAGPRDGAAVGREARAQRGDELGARVALGQRRVGQAQDRHRVVGVLGEERDRRAHVGRAARGGQPVADDVADHDERAVLARRG